MLNMIGIDTNNDMESLLYHQKTPAMKVIKLMTLFAYETMVKNNDVSGFVNSMQTI